MSPFRKIQPPGAKLKMGSLFLLPQRRSVVSVGSKRRSYDVPAFTDLGSLVPFLWFAWLASLLSFFASLRQRTRGRKQAGSRCQLSLKISFLVHKFVLGSPFLLTTQVSRHSSIQAINRIQIHNRTT